MSDLDNNFHIDVAEQKWCPKSHFELISCPVKLSDYCNLGYVCCYALFAREVIAHKIFEALP